VREKKKKILSPNSGRYIYGDCVHNHYRACVLIIHVMREGNFLSSSLFVIVIVIRLGWDVLVIYHDMSIFMFLE
jgi:hypothetical protein